LLRLSSHQATLLSSIWAQAISPKNTPKNYEAIAHTYSLLLLFLGSKVLSFYKLSFIVCIISNGACKNILRFPVSYKFVSSDCISIINNSQCVSLSYFW
jgi:hypothetical protein